MDSETVIVPILGVLLPIIITLGAFVMVVYLRKYENIERLNMIDKGISPEIFKRQRSFSSTMRWAFLLIGVGLGFLMGYWLDNQFDMQEPGYFSMLFIWGGVGLAVGHLFDNKYAGKE